MHSGARVLRLSSALWKSDFETPGITHTPVSDHPQGAKLYGVLEEPIDFFDGQGNFMETLDVWWYIHHYETYCREHGLPINKELYI